MLPFATAVMADEGMSTGDEMDDTSR